ncbi:hypothetical protein [Selenomonas ruminantium]|uniref:Uncharacterized protein n=1 Tax=Selenomonas ruminantium TaxID=971 RepID=A0A1H3YWA8_SELRU|nr:hypothetical protein [Selenomonas ruminantium]SEA15786.1 hypothetical protein SAMN05660648_02173 [Selenomonas ruminantium]
MRIWRSFQEKKNRMQMFFLKFLNSRSDKYILKGTMALRACYNSDMNAYSIELESDERENLEKICNGFAKKYKFEVVQIKGRVFWEDCYYLFHEEYGTLNIILKKPVASLRGNFKRKVNGIMTYDVNIIFNDMMNHFNDRYGLMSPFRYEKKMESLINILFIYKNYRQELWGNTLMGINNLLAYKGVYKIDCFLKSRMDERNKSEVKFVNKLCGDVRWLFRDLGLGYESESDENMLCLMNIRERDNTLSFVGYPEGKNMGRFHMIMDRGTGEVLKLDVPVSEYTVKAQKKMADLIRRGIRIPETEMVCWERNCDWYAGKSGDNPYEVHWVKTVGGLMGKPYLDKHHGTFNSLKEAQLSVRDWWLKNNFSPPYVRQCLTKNGDVWLDYGQYTAFYVFKQVWPHGNEGKGDSHGD